MKITERKMQLTRAMAAASCGEYIYRWVFALFNGRKFHCITGDLDSAYKVFLDEWGRSRILEVQTITRTPIKFRGCSYMENSLNQGLNRRRSKVITVVSVMPFAGLDQWMIIGTTLFVSLDLENRAKALYPTAKRLDPIDAYSKALAADSFLKAKWRWSKNEKDN